ncbi:MAG: M48 family metalloprotease [Deltaproteobacteria bacterium]|nr:M48 family metalloprotease [Deltaproteobacteria bacterium]
MVSHRLLCRCPLGARLVGVGFILLLVIGCAVNPATKERELMIVSEDQEFRIGQGVDKQLREEMGVYLELPDLRALVKEVVENLGRNSDRPHLIYRVEIVDTPDFNAFAVPGGFVYVHRGLLERMNSVDELASVLGHEIAHVAARHSAAQISKAQLMNIGLLGVAVATKGAVQDYGQLINMGAALAFNKFSRDDEREADYFGTQYLTLAGYNPRASIEVMKHIQRLETREPSTVEVWFMTHPPTSERLVNLNHEIEKLSAKQPETLLRSYQRNRFIRLLDGLVVGEWNGNELIRGDNYYNKEYLLQLEIPQGWQARINSKDYAALFADAKKDYSAYFDIEPLQTRKTVEEYSKDFEQKLRRAGLRQEKTYATNELLPHGAKTTVYSGYDGSRGAIMVEGAVFVSGANGYSLIGSSKREDFDEFRPLLESMVANLRFISQQEANQLQPPRLQIHTVEKGESWGSLTQKYFGVTEEKAKLAEYNGFEVSQVPPPGTLIKVPPSLRF